MGRTDDMAFQALNMVILRNSPSLGHHNYHIPFSFSVHKKAGDALGVLTQKRGDQYRPLGYYSQQLHPVAWGSPAPCLRAIAAAALLVKARRKWL